MLTLACANSSQHTVNLHSTPFAVRSVQNTRSKHNQLQRKTNMMIINSRHLHYSLIITARRFKTKLKFIFDLTKPYVIKMLSVLTPCDMDTCWGSDNKIFIWNVGMGEVLSEIDFPDIPLSCSWNWDGSRFAVACKDHKLRIVEPRTGKFIRVSTLDYRYVK